MKISNKIEIGENSECLENGLYASIDWMAFTFFPDEKKSYVDVADLLGFSPEDFKKGKGRNGYKTSYVLDLANIHILSDGTPEMGIHVDISGAAISTLLASWREKNTIQTPFGTAGMHIADLEYTVLLDLLYTLSKYVTFTRIDLAIDDIGCNYFRCDEILQKFETGQYISKFRTFEHRAPRSLKDGSKRGEMITVGQRVSDTYLRIYDKKLEYENKRRELIEKDWIRWELELKHERADRVVELLLEYKNLSKVCAGVLNNYLRFTIPLPGSPSDRITDPKWENFVNHMDKIPLWLPAQPKTIDDTKRWLDKSAGASIAAVLIADGNYLFFEENFEKWKYRYLRNRELQRRVKASRDNKSNRRMSHNSKKS